MDIEPWRPSLTPSKSRYSEGGSTARLIRLSRRHRRVVAESTTIISVWADTIDIMKTTRESNTLVCVSKEAVVLTATSLIKQEENGS